MKKLLLTMLLLFTVTIASAQSQFVRNYTKIFVIRKDKEPKWESTEKKINIKYKNTTKEVFLIYLVISQKVCNLINSY